MFLSKLRRTRVAPAPAPEPPRWDEIPGSVRFQTAWARRRHIHVGPIGDTVHFVAPRARRWVGQALDEATPQTVSRGTLPDTVTCGGGYIEVLAFTDDGLVVNEVRTHGDEVIVLPEPVALFV